MNSEQKAPTAPVTRQFRIHPSLTGALVLGFGSVIVVGMFLVQGIAMWSAQKNTRELLSDNAEFAMVSLVRETRRRLSPVVKINEYIQRLIDTEQIDIEKREQFGELLLAAMASTDQVYGMGFLYPDGTVLRVRRGRGMLPDAALNNDGPNPQVLAEAKEKYQTYWGQPHWLAIADSAVMTARTPIWQGQKFKGLLITAVTTQVLSKFIARSAALPLADNRFILYGRNHVLAHKTMVKGKYPRDKGIPLPRLNQIDDPVLSLIWDTTDRRNLLIDLDPPTKGRARLINGDTHIFLYREMKGFGDTPLLVGIYAGPEDGLGIEFRRIMWAGITGLIVILICVVGAVFLGRGISAPIRALAAGSSAVAVLDFDHVHRLAPSRVRELNDASDAFNRMTTGLRSFETYVPRRVVQRLIEQDRPIESELKQVTVMFTDIVGFSTLSEQMPAPETAAMLNDHFAILVDCIEAEGGTVDKYIGDSVMAFWEPDETGVNVDRALRAARAIRDRVSADNIVRRREDRVAPKLRVGIHTGDAIVGNIGSPRRVNYTLVGDTVNVAARLEQLSKDIGPEGEAKILVSGDTVALADDRRGLKDQGRHGVRGRDQDIDVWSLE